jgi:TolB-like protein
MAKAEPGSAIISADVCRLIRGPLAERFASRGTVQLDKMNETIEIYAPRTATQAAATPKPASAARSWKLPPRPQLAMIGGTALLVLVALLGWHLAARPASPEGATTAAPTATTPEPSAASIAVLPFENLSTDKDNEFFATGIQDEILTRLAKIGSLKVISRTSTANLGARPGNLPKLAEQLGVANILEGSVQRRGDAVRVNVQLIKASTDEHLWAEIYDRKMDDIFAVQSEIAIAIAQALSATVTGTEKKDLAAAPTENSAAYDAYLRGLAFIRKTNFLEAARTLQQAVTLDPDFAPAWALLSQAHARAYHNGDRTASRRDAAQHALKEAVRLQPDALETLRTQAYFQYWVLRDFAGARQRFEQVAAKWPNDAEATSALGYIARRQGRWDDALTYLKRGADLDPLSMQTQLSVPETMLNMRDYAGSLSTADAALNKWPDAPQLIGIKALALQAEGRMDLAKDVLATVRPVLGDFSARDAIYYQAVYTRQFAPANEAYSTFLAQDKELQGQSAFVGLLEVYLGDLKRLAGDAAGAKAHYERALAVAMVESKRQPDNPFVLEVLALASCGLGDRVAAMTYADRLVALVPVTADAFLGMVLEGTRLRVWARFGDADRAIPALERLLKAPGGFYTPAILRVDPDFDKLRGNPRFEALLK